MRACACVCHTYAEPEQRERDSSLWGPTPLTLRIYSHVDIVIILFSKSFQLETSIPMKLLLLTFQWTELSQR